MSKSIMRKKAVHTTDMDKDPIIKALNACSMGILLLDVDISSPWGLNSNSFTHLMSNTKVVVFMPPPVPPGDAPININTISTKSVIGEKSEILKVLKPAVLGVTAWKNEKMIFSRNVCSDRLLLPS